MPLEPNKIYCGDCLDVMQNIDDGSIDMILCDLPYGVTARNSWDVIIPLDGLWQQYNRTIKDNGAIVLTATQPFASLLINSNLNMFRYDWIWTKPIATGFLNANKMPLRCHEHILIFYKNLPTYNPQKSSGKPYKLTQRSETTNYNKTEQKHTTINIDGSRMPLSVIHFGNDTDKYFHPTQKPINLFAYLIKTYTNKNELVLDNCIGSGTTALACLKTNRNYIGIEKDQEYFEITNKRINDYKKSSLGF